MIGITTMINRHAVSLRSPFSFDARSDLNHLDALQANHALGQAGVSANANLHTGNLLIKDRAQRFPDIGGEIEFAFTYNSLNQQQPWQLCAARSVKLPQIQQDAIAMIEPDGTERIYQLRGDKYVYSDSHGTACIQLAPNGDYIWRHNDSRVTDFINKNGQTYRRIDASGNETNYQYQGTELSAIIAPSGVIYNFIRTNNKIEVIRKAGAESTLVHTYVLNENNALQQSITPEGYVTEYL